MKFLLNQESGWDIIKNSVEKEDKKQKSDRHREVQKQANKNNQLNKLKQW